MANARQLFLQKLTTRPYPGFAQIYCNLDNAPLTSFLERMAEVAPSGTDTEWLRNLIGKTSPNSIEVAGMYQHTL